MKTLLQMAVISSALAVSAMANTGARVFCWAPHLSAPILLNSHGQGIGSYAGRPHTYRILGVAGSLTLGNQCDGAFPDPNDPQSRFRQGWWIGGIGWPRQCDILCASPGELGPILPSQAGSYRRSPRSDHWTGSSLWSGVGASHDVRIPGNHPGFPSGGWRPHPNTQPESERVFLCDCGICSQRPPAHRFS